MIDLYNKSNKKNVEMHMEGDIRIFFT